MSDAPRIVGEYEIVAADRIREHPRNPNEGDQDVLRGLIRKHGFRRVLEVQRSTGYITAGNNSYRAGKAEGMATFPVTWTDDDDSTALERVISDNRARDLAVYDDQTLGEILLELEARPEGLDGTGFTADALHELVAQITGSDAPTADGTSKGTGSPQGAAELRLLVVPVPVDSYDSMVTRLETARDTWDVPIGVALARILAGTPAPHSEG